MFDGLVFDTFVIRLHRNYIVVSDWVEQRCGWEHGESAIRVGKIEDQRGSSNDDENKKPLDRAGKRIELLDESAP